MKAAVALMLAIVLAVAVARRSSLALIAFFALALAATLAACSAPPLQDGPALTIVGEGVSDYGNRATRLVPCGPGCAHLVREP